MRHRHQRVLRSTGAILCCTLSGLAPAAGHAGSHHHAKKGGTTAGAVASGANVGTGVRHGQTAGWTSGNGPFIAFDDPWPNFKKYDTQDHSHNWCPVKESILSGALHFKDALRGRNVSFLMAQQDTPVSVIYDWEEKRINGGLPVEVFEEIARRAGFNWRYDSTVTKYIDRSSNETDEQWLMWATQKFDVVDWFTITPKRSRQGLHFAYPFINISPHLVGKVKAQVDTVWDRFLACFSPFSWWLWAMIAVGFFFSAIVYVCLEHGQDDIPQKTSVGSASQAFFLTVCQFTGGGGYAPATPAGKLFVMSASFLVMLIVTAYTANLASEMIIEKVAKAPIQSVEDAITRNLPICVRSGSPFFRMLSRHFPDVKMHLVDHEEDKYHAVDQDKCIAAVTGQTWWDFEARMARYNPKCDLYPIGRNLLEMYGSYVAQATSRTCKEVVIDVLTFNMHQMYLDGFLDEVKALYIDEFQDVFCPVKQDAATDNQQMQPRHMFGIFLAHGLVSVFCIAISCWNGHFALPGSSYRVFSDGEEDSREADSEE